MKIRILSLLVAVLFLSACGTTKVVRSTQKGLKGNWVLSSITTSEGNLVDIKTLFNQASPQCFEGSTWSFVSNNNSGTYQFQNSGCDTSTHSIKWFMEEAENDVYFLWKFIPEGLKAKDVKAGYQLRLMYESETDLELEQEAAFEGEFIKIYYHFTKI